MAKILISGYYGFGNLGDELLLEALLDDVRRVRPDAEVTVLSARPLETAKRFGVTAIHRTDPVALRRAMQRCDLLLSGGGTLLQDGTSRRSLWYYLAVIRLARELGKPVMIYSQGLGPLNHPRDRAMVRRTLEDVQAVTLRDEASGRLLGALGAECPFSVTADPVLALPMDRDQKMERRIGWVLHGGTCNRRLLWVLEETAERLAGKGYSSVLLPFYPREDGGAVRHLAHLWETAPPDNLLGTLETCGTVVSMRLHGLILGANGGSRVLALSRDVKVEQFLGEMALPDALDPWGVTAEELTEGILRGARPVDCGRLDQARTRLEENRRQLERLLQRAAP